MEPFLSKCNPHDATGIAGRPIDNGAFNSFPSHPVRYSEVRRNSALGLLWTLELQEMLRVERIERP